MNEEIKRHFKRTFSSAVWLISIFVVSGCETTSDQGTTDTEKPGLYNLKGWAYKPYHSYNNEAEDADIDGKVGYPLTVGNPTARVVPRAAGWNFDQEVVSGALPPGLAFGNIGQIEGIPTQRGHWIVRLRAYNLSSGGQTYGDFQQNLRFHITGSGDVNPTPE
jgi:hypothetical protein